MVRDHLGHDPHGGKNQDIDFRMPEKPEEVLPQQRIAAARNLHDLSADHQGFRQEEARSGDTVHELKDRGSFQWRERQQQRSAHIQEKKALYRLHG